MNASQLIDYNNPQLILVGFEPGVYQSKFLVDFLEKLREERSLVISYFTFGFMGSEFKVLISEKESSFFVISNGFITIEQMCDYCRLDRGADIIVLDWLHLPEPEMEKAVKGLRGIVDETNQVIIAAFATPRVKDYNKRLLEDMAAVADMGEVYDLADDIWFLYAQDVKVYWDKQIIDLMIGKGKLVKSQEIKNKDLLGWEDRCYDHDVPKKVHQKR